jgi:hypothetical protein
MEFYLKAEEWLKQFSFEVEFYRRQTRLIRFKRDDIRIDVWASGTLGIYRNGKQSFFKNLSTEDIKEKIANL